MTTTERFFSKVEKSSGCWLWTASTRNGYGQFRSEDGKTVYAHRFSFEFHNGEIPAGMTIDHLCRNRVCVNPEHLEVVDIATNIRRGGNSMKTHCKNGHELAGENLYVDPRGFRECRTCRRAYFQ